MTDCQGQQIGVGYLLVALKCSRARLKRVGDRYVFYPELVIWQ